MPKSKKSTRKLPSCLLVFALLLTFSCGLLAVVSFRSSFFAKFADEHEIEAYLEAEFEIGNMSLEQVEAQLQSYLKGGDGCDRRRFSITRTYLGCSVLGETTIFWIFPFPPNLIYGLHFDFEDDVLNDIEVRAGSWP